MPAIKAKEFKVTCSDWNGGVRGRPSRTIAIQADSTLYDLAGAALYSFDFGMDHAFGFYDNIRTWTRSTEGYELFADMGEADEFPGVKETKLSKAYPVAKKKLLLLFDYGDEWRFIVQYVKDLELPQSTKLPVVLSSKGDAPDQYGYDDDEYEDDETED